MSHCLTVDQMKQVIEGKGHAPRIPITYRFWINPETFGERKAEAKEILDAYPEDVVSRLIRIPDVFDAPEDDKTYRWVQKERPKQEKNLESMQWLQLKTGMSLTMCSSTFLTQTM